MTEVVEPFTPGELPDRRDLTHGPVGRHLARLAAPAVVSWMLHNLYGLNDLFFAGLIGADEQTAVATSLYVVIALAGCSRLVAIGALATVSRLSGERAPAHEIARHVRQALFAATAFGAIVGAIGWLTAPAIGAFVTAGGPAAPTVATYLRGLFLGAPALLLAPTIDALFRARGTTAVAFAMEVAGVVVNVVLNAVAVLVLGWGVEGVAVATVLSRVAACTLGLAMMARGGLRIDVALWPPPRPDRDVLRTTLRIGLPDAIEAFLFALIYMTLSRVVAGHDHAAAGGLGAGLRIEGFCFLIMVGVGAAVGPLVGQNLGARRPDRATRAAKLGAVVAGGIGLGLGTLFWVAPEVVVGLLARDADLAGHATSYLRIAALAQVFTGVEIALAQAMKGAGHTVPPAVVSVGFSVLRVPLAWLAGSVLGLDVTWIWWVIGGTAILRGVAMAAVFAGGRWKGR